MQESVLKIYRHTIQIREFREIRMTLEVSPVQCHQKKDFSVLAVSPPPTDLNPELTDFCSCFQITLAITEFHDDENES